MKENLTTHRLSFGNITVINKDIAEIILDEGIEISLDMIAEFWQFVDVNMKEEISLILNKTAPFSYKFDALMSLSETQKLKSIAVISYDQLSTTTAEYMRTAFNKSGKNIEIFESKEAALHWLNTIDT